MNERVTRRECGQASGHGSIGEEKGPHPMHYWNDYGQRFVCDGVMELTPLGPTPVEYVAGIAARPQEILAGLPKAPQSWIPTPDLRPLGHPPGSQERRGNVVWIVVGSSVEPPPEWRQSVLESFRKELRYSMGKNFVVEPFPEFASHEGVIERISEMIKRAQNDGGVIEDDKKEQERDARLRVHPGAAKLVGEIQSYQWGGDQVGRVAGDDPGDG